MRTGSWDMMDWNCAGFKRPESRKNSSSVRMVLRERLAAAGSMPMVLLVSGGDWVGDKGRMW